MLLHLIAMSFCSQRLREPRIDCCHNVCHVLFDGYLYWKYPTALSDSMNNKKNSTKAVFPIHGGALSVKREDQTNFFITHSYEEETTKQTKTFVACVHHVCRQIYWNNNDGLRRLPRLNLSDLQMFFRSKKQTLLQSRSSQMHHGQDLWKVVSLGWQRLSVR